MTRCASARISSSTSGGTAAQVAEVFQVNRNTVRNHFKTYRQSGITPLGQVASRGSSSALGKVQLFGLHLHLQAHLYVTAKALFLWVEKTFQVSCTDSEMTTLLHRFGDTSTPAAPSTSNA